MRHVSAHVFYMKHVSVHVFYMRHVSVNVFYMRHVSVHVFCMKHVSVHCLLCWGYESSAIFFLQKKAIRIISGANIKSHTEPIFKLYNLLKIEDIYKSKLLILYYKILKLSSPRYFDTFILKNSAGVSRYPIRNPRWQPTAIRHTYITSTSRYQLAVLLNPINNTHDMMSNVIEHIRIISLLSFKATIKPYLKNKYSYFCSIINCYICKQYQ